MKWINEIIRNPAAINNDWMNNEVRINWFRQARKDKCNSGNSFPVMKCANSCWMNDWKLIKKEMKLPN